MGKWYGNIEICHGATRTVLLTGDYAIKVPTTLEYRLFLHGLLANMQERTFSRLWKTEQLAKVVWGSRFGIILIMERVRPIRHTGLYHVELARAVATSKMDPSFIKSDAKYSNFGYDKDNRFVKLDYGN